MIRKVSVCKGMVSVLLVLVVSLFAQAANAVPIDQINIPIVGATYNSMTGDFTISGTPASPVSVFYNDGRTPNPETLGSTIFTLSTIGLNSQISNGGLSIDYTPNGGSGSLNLVQQVGPATFNSLLVGNLKSFSMDIINPGAFRGSGEFDVTGGSLAQDFGANGGLTKIGIAFTVPADFTSSFAALANTQLAPTGSVPIPGTLFLFGGGFTGFLAWRWNEERKFLN